MVTLFKALEWWHNLLAALTRHPLRRDVAGVEGKGGGHGGGRRGASTKKIGYTCFVTQRVV